MKSIVYLVALILSLSITENIQANKNAESNKRKRPDWVQAPQSDYIVANGIGITIADAKSNAENSLKELVVDFGVDQMKMKNNYFKETDINTLEAGKLFKSSSYFSKLEKENHEVFYYEKLKDKQTKLKTYSYYLRYPIVKDEIDKAINELAFNHKVSETLYAIREDILLITNVSEFEINKVKLKNLKALLSKDDLRRAECEELLATIEENHKSIEIQEMLNIPGKLIVCQTLNDRAILNSEPPTVKSKSALIGKIENVDEQWIITYKYLSSQKKFKDDISVEFNNEGAITKKDISFNLREERVEVKLTGAPVVIKRKKMVKFYVASSYRGDIVLERIVLRNKDEVITDTRLNQLLDGAGFYTIRCQPIPGFFKVELSEKVSGELYYKSKATGHKEVFRFYNQKLDEVL